MIALFFGFVLLVALLIAYAVQGETYYDVQLRGGAPYCPRCNRQVSYRRNYCRCCGYVYLKSVERPPQTPVKLEPLQDPLFREIGKKGEDLFYAAGVLVGKCLTAVVTFACFVFEMEWFRRLPDWLQATIIGLSVGIPLAIIAFLLFR
jgi:hypothetical protein